MLVLTDQNFTDEIQKSNLPMVVDFWAGWCGPCKIMHPVLDDLEKELEGKVIFAKVDVDANQKMSEEYAVTSIPLILFMKEGKTVGRHIGLLTKKQMLEKMATYFG